MNFEAVEGRSRAKKKWSVPGLEIYLESCNNIQIFTSFLTPTLTNTLRLIRHLTGIVRYKANNIRVGALSINFAMAYNPYAGEHPL